MKDPQTESVQPFSVRINPDATFLADLHAHLCDSEIIGLLGGYYSEEEKCIYIQAAFPCKSTDRTDSGSTDVEMDPVFQIYATEAIANHGMTAVGWYHSHPEIKLIINSCSKAAIWPEETLKSVLLLASLLALMMAEILGHNLS